MKLAPLITQYLYSTGKLELPGIGLFRLEQPPGELTGSEKSQKTRSEPPGTVTFEAVSVKEAPGLVAFISEKTRKQKALASADLESHIELIQQFLNIGKPFLLEGIGNLIKTRTGEYIFTSGEALPEALKDYSAKEISATSSTEESFTDYRKPINKESSTAKLKRPVSILLLLIGIGIAIWGGYTVYKLTSDNKDNDEDDVTASALPPVASDTATTANKDSLPVVQQDAVLPEVKPVAPPAGQIKYILEEALAKRAFERFAKLKTFQWPVQLETADSVTYRLYMLIPSTYNDTARVKDSLYILNGKKVSVAR